MQYANTWDIFTSNEYANAPESPEADRVATYRGLARVVATYETPGDVPEVMAESLAALREEVLAGYLKTAVLAVRRYRRSEHYEDIVQEALLGMVEAVADLPNHDRDADFAVTHASRERAREFISDVFGITRVPSRSRRKGKGTSPDVRLDIEECPFVPAAGAEAPSLELRDALDSAAETEQARTVLRLRAEGYKHPEIADILDVSVSRISKILRPVRERFEEMEASYA